MKQRRHTMTVLACFVIAASFFSGCKSEVEERTTLTLHMASEAFETKSITPQDTPLEVARFVVSGEGPDNTRFSTTTNKTSVTVSGLLIGQWTVHAIGQNSDGVDMVEGTTTLQLKPEATTATLNLNSLKGTGTIDLTVNWQKELITNPGFELIITDQNGKVTIPTLDTSTLANGYIRFIGRAFAAGSYQVVGKLLSADQKTAGFAEAVRVVDGLSSTADITLNLHKTNEVPSTITLVNEAGVPVECTITGLTSNMAAGVPATATLSATEAQTLEVTWFLDGEQVGKGLSHSFTPELGPHRLDVMAKGPLLGTTGSTNIEFNAVVKGDPGIPVFMKQVNDGTNNFHIGGKTHAAFLPDGKFLIWSEATRTLQICQLNRNDIQVVTTYTTSNSDFTLSNIADIAVDGERDYVYIADNDGPKVTKYRYVPSTSTLSKICESHSYAWEVAGIPEETYGTFGRLGRIAIDQTVGRVYLSTPNTTPAEPNVTTVFKPDAMTADTLYATSAFWSDPISNVAKTQTMMPKSFDVVDISADSNYLTALDKEKDLIVVSKRYEETLCLALWPISAFHNDLSGLNDINAVTVLDPYTILAGTDTSLTMIRTNMTQSLLTFSDGNIYMSGDTEIGGKNLNGVFFLKQSADQSKIYILASESKNMITCSYANGQLAFLGEIPFESFSPSELVVSDDQSVMLLISDTSDALWILRVPTESV
ncbi:MAG: hypothetical protein WC096_02595 [Sphaerochaetaceae bacterium]